MKNKQSTLRCQNYEGMEKEFPGLKKNVSLKRYTTFHIGGPAEYFFKAKNEKDLTKVLKTAKRFNVPFFVLGQGSNLLISDKGFKGIVIKCELKEIKFFKKGNKAQRICVGAGVKTAELLRLVSERSLSGLEWAVGMPGTIGGCIFGNAGAFKNSMAEITEGVKVLNVKDFKIKKLKNKDCKFGYKESIFKKDENLIILGAYLKFKKRKKVEIKKAMKGCLDYRKKTQPLNFSCAGSFFKNPKNNLAGKLIEEAGFKGKEVGNIKVSGKHANFVVNLGKGKSKDVIRLLKLIKKKVKSKFKIKLEEEVRFLGF